MADVETWDQYKENFPEMRREKALEYALDTRKFEIDLYWKRATYFWTLIAATFAGYFVLGAAAGREDNFPEAFMPLIFLVTCIGLLLSLGWYLVNRGSKYWQENWERHVEVLESDVIGPLYKTTLSHDGFKRRKFWDGYPYSVSKVNQLISLFVLAVWFVLVIGTPFLLMEYHDDLLWPWDMGIATRLWLLVMLVLTAVFAILLLWKGQSRQENVSKIRFNQVDLE